MVNFSRGKKAIVLLALLAGFSACKISGGDTKQVASDEPFVRAYTADEIEADQKTLASAETDLQQCGLKLLQHQDGTYDWDPQTQQEYFSKHPDADPTLALKPLQAYRDTLAHHLKKYGQPYGIKINDHLEVHPGLSDQQKADMKAKIDLLDKSIMTLRQPRQ